jgi:pyruvate formate-lyase activating enzyme-like uncharacterized protein
MHRAELDHPGIIQQGQEEYAPLSGEMRWITPDDAAMASSRRQELLDGIRDVVQWAFNDTKPFSGRISPGCRLCGEGAWSCLFINNLCNTRCFFCPTKQDNLDEPGTSTLTFTNPEGYADYLQRFGFNGASISGGEPLLTFDKTLAFMAKIKERIGKGIYLWLYTNGTLSTKDKIHRLADTGLDEIRFNIVATDYDLSKARMAVDAIPQVTVEIPAVPEDEELMKRKLKEMADSGIAFLNLHQIRCTKHNVNLLTRRNYTFLHGPQIGILESEMTALNLLRYAIEESTPLGINYCSLIYRQRFQTKAARRRWAPFMAKPYEALTEAGMIRTLSLKAEPHHISRIEAHLTEQGKDSALWSTSLNKDCLLFSHLILPFINPAPDGMLISYSIASVLPHLTYRNPFQEIKLATGKKIVIERSTVFSGIKLSMPEFELFRASFLDNPVRPADMDAIYCRAMALDGSEAHRQTWHNIIHAEGIRAGLLEYY